MTYTNMKVHQDRDRENVSVWFCKGCVSYHVKAGEVLLTFDKREFTEFMAEGWNCISEQEADILALQD